VIKHGHYSSNTNCRTKIARYIWRDCWYFRGTSYLFHDFSWNLGCETLLRRNV